MKKMWMALVAVLTFFLLTGTALASEIPSPDFYFNAGAEKQVSEERIDYDYALTSDPRMAVEAYVTLLTEAYGFELTDSYLEPEMATWRLENDAAAMIRIDYDQGGEEYYVGLRVDSSIACNDAESWDWTNQVIAGTESNDITVLPDFLKYDSSGKYYYRGYGHSFQADSTSSACVDTVKDYADLLMQRGYTLVNSEEKHSKNWDMYKWYLHSGVSGLPSVENRIKAHVMVRINVNRDENNCRVDMELVQGITMSGYGGGPINVDDFFEKNCGFCGYDGTCNDCNGLGYVWKNAPGTREYVQQSCENCNFGNCKFCGGDGRTP